MRPLREVSAPESLVSEPAAVGEVGLDELPRSISALLSEPPMMPRRLESVRGPSASLSETNGRERLQVRDAEERVLFELDTLTGKATVMAPRGGLSFAAPDGDIEFLAKGSVRFRAERIELVAGQAAPASLVLGEKLLTLSARGVVLVAERLESTATRIFETARNVYRQVEELHQLRAARIRTVASEGHHLRAGHVAIEADEEVRIDGARIHLG